MSGAVLGVDGCRAGWLAVALPEGAPERARACLVARAEELLALGAQVVAIDSPIGLMDTPEDGPRPPDLAARAFLSDRNTGGLRAVGSRVFAAPSRAHLGVLARGGSYADLRAAFPPPRSLSKQCWNICPKIAELDALLERRPDAPLWEVHPEISFAHQAGRTLAPKKSTSRGPSDGPAERRALLVGRGFDLDALAGGLGPPGGRWGPDDLLDACVAALSAMRIARGEHAGLPNRTDRDTLGRRRCIFY